MKGFLNKVQQKKGAPNATDGKPAGGESNVRVDISLPKTQRRYSRLSYVETDMLSLSLVERTTVQPFNDKLDDDSFAIIIIQKLEQRTETSFTPVLDSCQLQMCSLLTNLQLCQLSTCLSHRFDH